MRRGVLRPALGLALALLAVRPAARPLTAWQLQPGPVKELGKGKILVASEALMDPNFAESVILLADHTPQGSMGLIINRKTDVTLATLLPDLKGPGNASLAFFGGPVESGGVLALVKSDSSRADTKRVLEGVYQITASKALDELVATGAGIDRLRVYVGYAGWSPGQLERETRAGAWHVYEGSAAVVFDPDPATLWKRQNPRADQVIASTSSGTIPEMYQ
jgi:putative transcriptional regulator